MMIRYASLWTITRRSGCQTHADGTCHSFPSKSWDCSTELFFENDVFISMELSIVMFWKYSQHGILIYSFLLDVEIKDLLCGVDIKDVSGKLKTVFVYVVWKTYYGVLLFNQKMKWVGDKKYPLFGKALISMCLLNINVFVQNYYEGTYMKRDNCAKLLTKKQIRGYQSNNVSTYGKALV